MGYKKIDDIKFKGKIARIYNGYYYSMFLKFNDKAFFDLEDNSIYLKEQIKIISKLKTKDKEISERGLSRRLVYKLKTL